MNYVVNLSDTSQS